MVQAERIEHAPEAVVEVQAEGEVGDDVDRLDPPDLKSGHDVVVDVVLDEASGARVPPTSDAAGGR